MHIPALRLGKPYVSAEKVDVVNHATGEKLAEVSQVNAGIVVRDLPKYAASREMLRKLSMEDLLAICNRAGQHFMESALPLGEGATQTPDDYVKNLSASSGLPHNMVRRNMSKINYLFSEMRTVLNGLTRNMDLRVLDNSGYSGPPLSFYPCTNALGVVLPSNSPGVNSLWMPSLALKIPVILKPGREEPWTPFRIIQAFIAGGMPAEAFGFYPTDHEGAGKIIDSCGRSCLFGDESTTARWANNPAVQLHGPGRSKILIGDDCIENWRAYVDVIVDSIGQNGGRSCVNASAVIVPKYAKEIAEELGKRFAPINAKEPSDPNAALSAFANVKMADWIDSTITDGLSSGADDLSKRQAVDMRSNVDMSWKAPPASEDVTQRMRIEAAIKELSEADWRALGAKDEAERRLYAPVLKHLSEEDWKSEAAKAVVRNLREKTARKQVLNGGTYLRSTIVHCQSFEHSLANKEFLFPYASVVEMPQEQMLPGIGHSLVVTAITNDPGFKDKLLASPLIDRLNIGPVSTMKVSWDQPHEGNLFEFLYKRRAIVYAENTK